MSVLLLSGCLIVPAAADEKTTDEEIDDLEHGAEEYRKQLEALSQHYDEIARSIVENPSDDVKSAILDQMWELYQSDQISKSQYWKMYNLFTTDYLSTKFGNIKLIDEEEWTDYPDDYFLRQNPKVDAWLDALSIYFSAKKKTTYTKADATKIVLIEAVGECSISKKAYKTLLDPQTQTIQFDEKALKEVFKLFFRLLDSTIPEDVDKSEEKRQKVLADGGRTFVSDLLNDRINRMYEVLYPFGIIIMLVCWMIGMTKSGLNATFDIKDKDSIARSMIDLVIGIGLLALTPWLIEVMTSLGFDLCDKVGIAWRPEIYDKDDSGGVVRWVIEALGIDTFKDELILVFIKGTLVLNIMRMALMQCLAPLSIGCIAGGDRTKNMSFGWLKEYLKLCLLPGVTAVYICIACASTHTIDNMWINIAIGFSFFLVPKMTMDKLFG